MEKKIPKSFRVFATTINIKYENERLGHEGFLGDCSVNDNQISLCGNSKGKAISLSVITDTFYHEKVHILLDSMGEHKLSQNEKFVEVFARLLRQSDKTAKF